MTTLTKIDRAALNALMLKGQLSAARCVERLMMDGETVLIVTLAGASRRIEILPPRPASPLWTDAVVWRLTAAEVDFVANRFGCQIRWKLTRAEAELMRIGRMAGRLQ